MKSKHRPPFSLLRYYALIRHICECSDIRVRLKYEGKLQKRLDRLNKLLDKEDRDV